MAAVIVAYASADDLDSCLQALLSSQDVDLEVVVVDNDSPEPDTDVALRHPVRVLTLQDNIGFAAGVNLGVGVSRAPLVLLLNPDCAVHPDTVARLVDALEAAGPMAPAAAAWLTNRDGTPQRFARRRLRPVDVLGAQTWLGRTLDRRVLEGRLDAARCVATVFDDPDPRYDVHVGAPAAACVLVRREELPDPPLDEVFPLYFNDTDLYESWRRDGRGEPLVVAAARATHGHGASVATQQDDRVRAEWVRALRDYMSRHWGALARRTVLVALFLDAAACLVWYVPTHGRHHPAVAHARGTLGGLGIPGPVAVPPLFRRPAPSQLDVRVVSDRPPPQSTDPRTRDS